MAEAEIGKVDAVDCSIVLGAVEALAVDVIELRRGVVLAEAVEVAAEGGVFRGGYFLKNES